MNKMAVAANQTNPFDQQGVLGIQITIDKHIPLPNRIDLHTHSCLEIGCCLSGTGYFYFSNKIYEVQPGDIFVVNHLEHHIAQADPENPCEFLFLFFDSSLLTDHTRLLAPFLYRPNAFQNKIPAQESISLAIRKHFEAIYEEFTAGREEYLTISKGILLQVLVLLYRYYRQTSTGNEEQFLQYALLIQPAISYMEKNFREPLQFSDVSSLLALSASRVRYLFSKTYGFGFQEYLNQLRINEAKRLLLTTEMSVLDVGLESGFQSQASFYRCFAEVVGSSPNQYRRHFN